MADASKTLAVTRMEGPEDRDPAELENPAWADIEDAIRRLDGKTCSLLILGIGEPPVPHMAIGGGERGQYIVYATTDNVAFHKLINPQAPPGKCLLVAGGQRGNYDRELCITMAEVLRAARRYAERGELDPALSWKKVRITGQPDQSDQEILQRKNKKAGLELNSKPAFFCDRRAID